MKNLVLVLVMFLTLTMSSQDFNYQSLGGIKIDYKVDNGFGVVELPNGKVFTTTYDKVTDWVSNDKELDERQSEYLTSAILMNISIIDDCVGKGVIRLVSEDNIKGWEFIDDNNTVYYINPLINYSELIDTNGLSVVLNN